MRVRSILALLCALPLIMAFAGSAQALTRLPSGGMQIGSEGSAVVVLQNDLKELGIYTQKADGVYGARTASAVRLLQARLGVPANGACNADTIAAFNALFIDQEIGAQSDPSPSPEAHAAEPAVSALKGKKIGIDAGHQKEADGAYEPIAPDSDRSRERMSEGGVGVKTGIPEYETALVIAKKLRAKLEAAGAAVYMTRTENDVHLSNIERAEAMNAAGVDCWVRIHCDSSSDPSVNGVHMLAPSPRSTPDIAADSLRLAKLLLSADTAATGAKPLSILIRADQTGFNWSRRPVVTAELGYLSNPAEDVRLNRAYYQDACAEGLFNGLLAYFQKSD